MSKQRQQEATHKARRAKARQKHAKDKCKYFPKHSGRAIAMRQQNAGFINMPSLREYQVIDIAQLLELDRMSYDLLRLK